MARKPDHWPAEHGFTAKQYADATRKAVLRDGRDLKEAKAKASVAFREAKRGGAKKK